MINDEEDEVIKNVFDQLYPVLYPKHCRNITGSTNLVYSKKVSLQVFVRPSFQGLLLFFGKEKLAKQTYFVIGCCFIDPPLIFAIQSLMISQQHIKLCISLLSESL